MTDPISVSSGVVALGTFALQSGIALSEAIRSFRNYPDAVRELEAELKSHNDTLQSLLKTANNVDAETDLSQLELPLLRCGKACKAFGDIIAKCSGRSSESKTSFRDWARLRYMGGNIDEFRHTLAGYKSTISIVLANANLRKCIGTAAVLQQYKDMIEKTTVDLEAHLLNVEHMVQSITMRRTEIVENDTDDLQQLQEERDSTRQCLKICALMSTRIDELRQTQANLPPVTSSTVITSRALEDCKDTLGLTTTQLERRLRALDERLDGIPPERVLSTEEAANIESMREEKDTINKCLNLCSEAYRNTSQLRVNTVEDINLGENCHYVYVSTVGDLIKAGTVTMGSGSTGWLGQMDNATIQQLSRDNPRGIPASQLESQDGVISQFRDRYGPGNKLKPAGENPSKPNRM